MFSSEPKTAPLSVSKDKTNRCGSELCYTLPNRMEAIMFTPSFLIDFGHNTHHIGMKLSDHSDKNGSNSLQIRHKILIVEDETLVAENIKEILESQNFSVVGIASSGREAIQKVEQERPDLILMDIRIKGDIDGIQTVLILQQSTDNSVPVVFVTAHSQTQFPHINLLKPNYLYLTKPYSETELLRAVKKGLKLQP